MTTNIIISGIGAIGGYYGGMLAACVEQLSSVEVFFFMRQGKHLDKVKSEGLHIVSPTIDLVAHPNCATSNPIDLPPADYLFLATKSYDLERNLNQLRTIIKPRTIIVPLHNGLDITPRIRKILPDNLILPAVCHITGRRHIGEIKIGSDRNSLHFGGDSELNKRISAAEYERAEWLYLLLKASGIRCRYFRNVIPRIHEKFLMLSPSAAATTFFDCPIGEVLENHTEEFQKLLSEIAHLYRAKDWSDDPKLEERAMELVLLMPSEATTSMHSDIKAGNPSELESLVGYPLQLAQELNLPMESYQMMYESIKKQSSEE